jgi:hypothetical protein
MDGRGWGIDGGLVASRPAACVKDTPSTALLHAVASIHIRIAPRRGRIRSVRAIRGRYHRYIADWRCPQGFDPESHEKQNLSQRCGKPSGMTRENGKLYLRSWPMAGVIRGDGWGVAVGSRNTRDSDGHY